MRDGLRQQRVADQRVRLRRFTGIHVWFAGVTCGIDDKFGLRDLKKPNSKSKRV
jgi:hypothetical protein